MSTKYPNQIDGADDLELQIDGGSTVRASTINELRDALIAIETELGVEPSGTFVNVKTRMDLIEVSLGLLDGYKDAADIMIVDADGYYVSDNIEGALQEAGAAVTSLPAPTAANVSLADADGYYTATNVEDALAELGPYIPVSASNASITDADGYYTATNVENALIELEPLRNDAIAIHIAEPADGYYNLVNNIPFDVEILSFTTRSDSGTGDGYLSIDGREQPGTQNTISSAEAIVELSTPLYTGEDFNIELKNNSSLLNLRSTIAYKRIYEFTPPGTPFMWFSADKEIGYSDTDSIETFTDFGSAGASPTQATEGTRPTYSNPVEAGLLNNKPAYTFANQFVQSGDDFSLTSITAMAFVARSTLSGTRTILDGNDVTNRVDMYQRNDNWTIYAGTVREGPAVVLNEFHSVVGIFDGASSHILLNGSQTNLDDPGSKQLDGITIGAVYSGSGVFDFAGDVAEILIYSDDSFVDAIAIDRYFTRKYGSFPQS